MKKNFDLARYHRQRLTGYQNSYTIIIGYKKRFKESENFKGDDQETKPIS
jgi:hypothetical protein